MDDLARDLGMSKKTLYRHFSHKEALLEAILDGLADSVAALFAPRPEDPAPSVPSHLRTVIAGISERLAAIQPAFLLSLKRFAPRQFERLDQLRRRNLEHHLIPLLEAGQRRGEIRRDLDPAFAVEILVQTLHGLLDPDVLHRLERTPAQAVSGAVDLVLRGLLEPASPAAHAPLRP
jgi:AcrR family transcriptional regulator